MKKDELKASAKGKSRLAGLLRFLKSSGMSTKTMAAVCGMTLQGFLHNVRQDDLPLLYISKLLNAAHTRGKFYFYNTVEELTLYRRLLEAGDGDQDERSMDSSSSGEWDYFTAERLDGLITYMKRHKISIGTLADMVGLKLEKVRYMFKKDNARLSRLILIAKQLRCHLLLDIRCEEETDLEPVRPTFIIRSRLLQADSIALDSILKRED